MALLLTAAALCNDARLGEETDGEPAGDPTELALARAAASLGLEKGELNHAFGQLSGLESCDEVFP